ncbi:hypothetical protein [Gracilimonas sp.]|uniref:hypothetical protein n=1 Tax=Gracilimonas sp. TaxID=1974203 RepID=UPI003BAB7A84
MWAFGGVIRRGFVLLWRGIHPGHPVILRIKVQKQEAGASRMASRRRTFVMRAKNHNREAVNGLACLPEDT